MPQIERHNFIRAFRRVVLTIVSTLDVMIISARPSLYLRIVSQPPQVETWILI